MGIYVLGPVHASLDDYPVYIQAGKPRQLLALLAANVDKPVFMEGIVHSLWADRPPKSARQNIHQYVHKLRTALGRAAVVARGQSYALAVGESLDSTRFRTLASLGRTAFDAGDCQSANESLRQALDLWHGDAFADVSACGAIAEEATALEQLRQCAHELWAETELALGRHRTLIPALTHYTQCHPYRELLRAQLMVALCRSGRRAEALAVYTDTYRTMRDDLGIEPCAELTALQRQILSGDPGNPVNPSGRAYLSADPHRIDVAQRVVAPI